MVQESFFKALIVVVAIQLFRARCSFSLGGPFILFYSARLPRPLRRIGSYIVLVRIEIRRAELPSNCGGLNVNGNRLSDDFPRLSLDFGSSSLSGLPTLRENMMATFTDSPLVQKGLDYNYNWVNILMSLIQPTRNGIHPCKSPRAAKGFNIATTLCALCTLYGYMPIGSIRCSH